MRLVLFHTWLGLAYATSSSSCCLTFLSILIVCEVWLDDLLETLLQALALSIVIRVQVFLLALNHSLVLLFQEGFHARHRRKTETILLCVRWYDDLRGQRPQCLPIHLMLHSYPRFTNHLFYLGRES